MTSKLKSNQAEVARLRRAVEVLNGEAGLPFVTPEVSNTLKAAATLLVAKIDWLDSQIAATEEPAAA